jgi:hypothetical protein
METSRRTRNAIICRQVLIKAVERVMMLVKKRRGRMKRRRTVEGSWKKMLLIVKIKMDIKYRLPVRSWSSSIDVTEAEEIILLRCKPAMVQRPHVQEAAIPPPYALPKLPCAGLL